MENKNSNNKLVVTLIIIIICLVLGGGFTIYTLLSDKSNPNLGESNNSDQHLNGDDKDSSSNNSEDNNKENENTDLPEWSVVSKTLVDTIEGNILVERVVVKTESNNKEYYLLYTKKDSAGKTIWTYKTEKDTDAKQCNYLKTHYIDGKIYIEENKNIIYLNKETGKANWKWVYTNSLSCPGGPRISTDTQNNTYITNDKSLAILDKKGNVKSNKTYNLEISDASIEFVYINENEGYLFGLSKFIQINLKDYKEKNSGTYDYLMSEDRKYLTYPLNYKDGQSSLLIRGIDNDGGVSWMYKTQTKPVGQYTNASIFKEYTDRIYLFDNDKIVVINKQSGKTLWSVNNISGFEFGFVTCDNKGNMYYYAGDNIYVYDANGNKTAIPHYAMIHTDGVGFKFVNDKELLIDSAYGVISIDIETKKLNYEIEVVRNSNNDLFGIVRKTDSNKNILWEYETNSNIIEVKGNLVYITENNKVITINLETGKES